MSGRLGVLGLVALGAFALLAWVAAVTAHLEKRQAVRLEAERDRRARRLEEAATGLGRLAERARALGRGLADGAPLRVLLEEGAGPARRAGAFAELDRELARVAADPAVAAIAVETAAGEPLAGYDARPGRAGSLRRAVAAVQAGARSHQPGATPLAVEADAAGGEAALAFAFDVPAGAGAVVVLAVDARDALRACAEAAAGGAWAIVDGEGRALAPTGAALPEVPGDLVARGGARAAPPDAIVAAYRAGSSGLALRARLPAGSAEEVAREVRESLALLGAALVPVALLGLGALRLTLVQRTLRESERHERFLQAVFDALGDVLLVVDAELRVSHANRAASQRLGPGAVGLPYDAVAERRGAVGPQLEAVVDVLREGAPRRGERVERDATVWQVAHFPILGPDGAAQGVVEVARDVTATRRLEQQLVQSEKLSMLGEMAAGIAHEINNPVGVVSMYAQLLGEELRESLGPEAAALEQVKTIEEHAATVAEIVRNLLQFSRKSEGRRQAFDVRRAVERALAIVEHQRMLRDVALERHLEVEPPPEVVGDEGQLAQVVLNLLVNACHALDGQGRLEVAVTRAGPDDPPPPGRVFGEPRGGARRIRITVRDTGKGIDPAHLDRIFEPFFTTKEVGVGTGLGLSVSFGIIRDHEGCIAVDTAVGRGTTFTLDLPASPGEGPRPAGVSA